MLRVTEEGTTRSWPGTECSLEPMSVSPTYSRCKPWLGGGHGSLNPGVNLQHIREHSTSPRRDPRGALAKMPRLLVIFPARPPPLKNAALSCRVILHNLLSSASSLQLILEELK